MSIPEPVRLMGQAADEVLGTMYFSFVDPVTILDDLMDGPVIENGLHGHIEFTGPVTGSMDSYCGEGPTRVLSANFLGEDEDEVGQEVIHDAFKELTNMIVGRFLALIEPEKVCTLGLPQVSGFKNLDLKEFLNRPDNALILDTGEGAIVLEIKLETGS